MLLCSTKIRLASINGCRRNPFVLCLIFARRCAGHSWSASPGNDLASIQHRARSKPSFKCIVRISSSLSFQTATDEYEVGYPEIRCSRDPRSVARKRELGRNFFRFVEIHCRYSVESRTFRGFSGSYNLPGIDASRLLRSLHTKCRSPKVSVLWNARL